MKNLLYISLLLFVCDSCTRPQTVSQQSLLEKKLKQKQTDYLKEKHLDCIDNALLEAEIYVDSIIYDMTQFSVLGDSLNMIQKPIKPERPGYLDINDPGPIVPFEIRKE